MPLNAALYLPVRDVDLTQIFPEARRAHGLVAPAIAFDVPFKGSVVRFNVMPSADVPSHLDQFVAYVSSLEDKSGKEAAIQVIEGSRTVIGLETHLEDEELGGLLVQIVDHYEGCIFMFDSVVLHTGEVLVGPLKESAA